MTPKYSAVETFPPYSPITGVILVDAKPPKIQTNLILGGKLVFSKNVLRCYSQLFYKVTTFFLDCQINFVFFIR